MYTYHLHFGICWVLVSRVYEPWTLQLNILATYSFTQGLKSNFKSQIILALTASPSQWPQNAKGFQVLLEQLKLSGIWRKMDDLATEHPFSEITNPGKTKQITVSLGMKVNKRCMAAHQCYLSCTGWIERSTKQRQVNGLLSQNNRYFLGKSV